MEKMKFKTSDGVLDVLDLLIKIWTNVLLPFSERDQTMTCAYPLSICQVLKCITKIEKMWQSKVLV